MTSSKRAQFDVFIYKKFTRKRTGVFISNHFLPCNRLCLKKTTENLILSAADTQTYIKVGVIFSDNPRQKFSLSCDLHAHCLLLQRQLFSGGWNFPSLGYLSIFDSRVKVKNKGKCNEELVALVKAIIDENARISLEKMASALNMSSGSASRQTA